MNINVRNNAGIPTVGRPLRGAPTAVTPATSRLAICPSGWRTPTGSFLKIQVGNRKPRLWLQASRDRFAGGLDVQQEGCL
jgi:hypothetical protein